MVNETHEGEKVEATPKTYFSPEEMRRIDAKRIERQYGPKSGLYQLEQDALTWLEKRK